MVVLFAEQKTGFVSKGFSLLSGLRMRNVFKKRSRKKDGKDLIKKKQEARSKKQEARWNRFILEETRR